MPPVHPTSVVSFSSEDPNHPASNLLNRDTWRKWKCHSEAVDRTAFVILKFDQAVQITGIDIGNESSAAIEICVGRSGGSGEVKYETLLSSIFLMTSNDARELKNPCGVKHFPASAFDKEIGPQKWDLVKVVVLQMFNHKVQFGLTFINFMAAPDPNAPAKIGIFSIRKKALGDGNADDDDEEDGQPSRIGAMFAKSLASRSQELKNNESSSTNAAIREVTKAISGASQSSSEHAVKEVLKRPKLDISSSPSSPGLGLNSRKGLSGQQSPSGNTSNWTTNDKLPSRNNLADAPLRKQKQNEKAKGNPSSQGPQSPMSLSGNSRSGPSSTSSPSSTTASNPFGGHRRTDADDANKPRKPFDKLFEGVVFVISGIQNPYRKNIRDRAVEMGARCKPDWDASCTHLICAFINTPKFREVRGAGNNGKIVKKEWIERSYGARVRFPWRRFCLDRNDKGAESEEEILAEEDEEGEDEEIQEEIQNDGNLSTAGGAGGEEDDDGASSHSRTHDQAEEEEESPQIETIRNAVLDGNNDDEDANNTPKREKDPMVVEAKKRKRPLLFDDDSDDDKDKLDEDVYNTDTDIDDDDHPEEAKEQENNHTATSSSSRNQVGGAGGNNQKDVNEDSSGEETDFEEPPADNVDQDDDEVSSFFFQHSTFFLFCPEGEGSPPFNEKDRIEQIILRRKGQIESELTEEVDFLITNMKEWNEAFSEAWSDNPNIEVVNFAWILQCEEDNKFLSHNGFVITPS